MSLKSATKTSMDRICFSVDAAAYLTKDCGIGALEDVAYLDGDGDVETTIKGVPIPGGIVTVGTGTLAVISQNNGIPVSIRAIANLKLCVYYLSKKHEYHALTPDQKNTLRLKRLKRGHVGNGQGGGGNRNGKGHGKGPTPYCGAGCQV
jgi:hypothetical protein